MRSYMLIPAALILSTNIVVAAKKEFSQGQSADEFFYLYNPIDIIDKQFSLFNSYLNNRLSFFYDSNSVKSKIITKDKQYVIVVEVPGFDKEQIKVKVAGNKLFINGNIEKDKGDKSEEQVKKKFNYVISLNDDVDQNGISSGLKNGILTIILPRIEIKEEEAKEVPIK